MNRIGNVEGAPRPNLQSYPTTKGLNQRGWKVRPFELKRWNRFLRVHQRFISFSPWPNTSTHHLPKTNTMSLKHNRMFLGRVSPTSERTMTKLFLSLLTEMKPFYNPRHGYSAQRYALSSWSILCQEKYPPKINPGHSTWNRLATYHLRHASSHRPQSSPRFLLSYVSMQAPSFFSHSTMNNSLPE